MKDYNSFINEEIHFSDTERDLGYGVKTNMVNIFKVSWYEDDAKIKEFLNLFGLPIKYASRRNPKHELKKIINELTLKDIERGYIIVFGNKVLQMNHSDFKNEITYNNVNIMPLSRSYKEGYDLVLNRKNIKLEDAKLVIRAHKAKNIKTIIKSAKTAPQTQELKNIYDEFGINFRYIDKRLVDNIEKLAQEVVNLRKKED